MLHALGRDDGDVIEIPALLDTADGKALTATADSVNMLVIRDGNGARCLVAKPFGPVCNDVYLFEYDIRRKLEGLGLTATFADEWIMLHCDDGEVHCGTNQVPDLATITTRPDATNSNRTWWLRAPP